MERSALELEFGTRRPGLHSHPTEDRSQKPNGLANVLTPTRLPTLRGRELQLGVDCPLAKIEHEHFKGDGCSDVSGSCLVSCLESCLVSHYHRAIIHEISLLHTATPTHVSAAHRGSSQILPAPPKGVIRVHHSFGRPHVAVFLFQESDVLPVRAKSTIIMD